MSTGHEWDYDAVCIHCNFDGAEWTHLRRDGEEMPLCTVTNEGARERNRRDAAPRITDWLQREWE